MHILLIPSWYPCTSADIEGSFFREQAIALKKQGCNVGVIVLQIQSLRSWKWLFNDGYKIKITNDEGVNTYRLNCINWYPRIIRGQKKLLRDYGLKLYNRYINVHGKPEIIHVHSMLYSGVIAYEISKKYKIPYVVTEHSTSFMRGLVNPSRSALALSIATSAKRRFAVSKPFATFLASYFKQKSGVWEVIPNIVNDNFFNHSTERIGSHEFVFLNVCFLQKHKCVDLLIKAFAKLFKGQPEIMLRIGGDGDQRQLLESLAYSLGIANQVQFLGRLSREQVCRQMAAANAFVLSSRYETFGVVVIEALALGKPVISTCCGGPEDIIRKEDGFLVPVNDLDAMVDAMHKLYKNLHKYDAEEIRSSCKLRYSEQSVSKRLLKIYSEVLN